MENSINVERKECRKCKELKPLSAFGIHPGFRDGHRNQCKACVRQRNIESGHTARGLANLQEWAKNNPGRVKERQRRWRLANPEKYRAKQKRHYYKNLDASREYHRKWQKEARVKNPELIEKVKKWNRENPESHRKHVKESRLRNIERRRIYESKYWRNRRAIDPNAKLRRNLRGRISILLRGKIKTSSTLKLLGCSIPDLWIYLESKFKPGMSRDNYGTVWEVDHIMPCAIFDLINPEHQKRCFHFSNLQPLFTEENRSKGATEHKLQI